jgi:hypothetical protein
MKPSSLSSQALRNGMRPAQRMPSIDCNFQASSYFYGGHCAGAPAPSFRNISRDYFLNEARHNFIGEAAVFIAIMGTAALAIGISAVAAFDFMRVLGYF